MSRNPCAPSGPLRPAKLQDQLSYPPRLMTSYRAAAYVGFGATKFLELVAAGIMPPSIDVDGNPRWDRHDLDAAVENLKDRRRDPVVRDRDRLQQRVRDMEEGRGREDSASIRDRAA